MPLRFVPVVSGPEELEAVVCCLSLNKAGAAQSAGINEHAEQMNNSSIFPQSNAMKL